MNSGLGASVGVGAAVGAGVATGVCVDVPVGSTVRGAGTAGAARAEGLAGYLRESG